jgi:signal transduction histidine kinase
MVDARPGMGYNAHMQGDVGAAGGRQSGLAAMDADQLLQRFTRCLVHNMSNPLAAILGCGQLLERMLQDGEPVDAGQCRAYVSMILSETEKCARALERLALLARPPELRPIPTDLHELIQRALDAFEVPDGISFALEREAWDPTVIADPELTCHVLVNLLQNAAEAMPEGGTITVRTENCHEGEKWVRLVVADEGPGIAPDLLPRITDPFFTTRQRHNGIGLTLCAQFISRQNGRLRIENGSPTGVRAIVVLPQED